ncbi:pheST operon leader peptide PheM [Klebsiella pneumoniae]|nr:pheST operon leader peptide PheM [Klebsiella pneumoniae]MBX7521281.1 pheST operon leader peptide PheM [Klebsiella pneumoniae]
MNAAIFRFFFYCST